jgi:two-component system, OmpR family, phosphate regulon sensor histidine kinase PhoR
MKNLENISSNQLIEEIQRRFLERETTIKDMNLMMKKMEEINKKLLKAEENKSKFMSIIKNEFNNPLSSMLSLSTSLLNTSNDEKVNFIGQTIQEEAHLLNFQINNIINAAEIESGTLDLQSSNADFKDITLQLMEDLKYPIKNKKAQIKFNISSENDFSFDREKVYRILINLVSNAVEYSPNNSNIEVDIFEEINDFKILVKDYGEGIEENERNKIFNRFYQAHSGMNRAHRGQGLGLSIVQDFINFLDGTINFDSKIGQFTIFEVTLPKLSKDNSMFENDDFMFSNFDDSAEF